MSECDGGVCDGPSDDARGRGRRQPLCVARLAADAAVVGGHDLGVASLAAEVILTAGLGQRAHRTAVRVSAKHNMTGGSDRSSLCEPGRGAGAGRKTHNSAKVFETMAFWSSLTFNSLGRPCRVCAGRQISEAGGVMSAGRLVGAAVPSDKCLVLK
jgi:hypothetical protein